MGDRCGDNRFEIIKKAKAELFKSTNIETSEDEMKVLDNFLFRCWQMGWLERYDKPREPLDIPTMSTNFIKEYGLYCPDGYIFKDENGNIINATKIVLEKKKKEYPKTYEECCDTLSVCSSEHASLVAAQLDLPMNTFIRLLVARNAYWKIAGDEMGLGKPWEPDWGKGACYTICCNTNQIVIGTDKFRNSILAFPTEEMRDAFYENFKELIKECKELL